MLAYLWQKLSFSLGLHRCVFCERAITTFFLFCQDCYYELPWMPKSCIFCCRPLPEILATESCGECLKQSRFYDKAFSLFCYEPPLTHLIPAFKFKQQLQYLRIFALLLAHRIKHFYTHCEKPDYLIAVPLHQKRLRERGYNQSLEIAKVIQKKCQIPLAKNACQRVRHTQPQSSLDIKSRQKNIKNAFLVNSKFEAKHIILIDDVMTTGHTLNELSRLFKKQGVTQIDVWCIAKTVRHYGK